MKTQIGLKFGVVWVILSTFILVPTLAQSKEKEKTKKEIIVSFPKPNQCVTSPLTVQGKARGPWFFEAIFPIRLLDAQCHELSASKATALGPWTTEDFVPFEGKLDFVVNKETKATLILEKDNPSGLPQNAKKIEIPVILVPPKK
jgi:hypothetical protein